MATYLALINFVVVLVWLLATCHWIQAIPSKWKNPKGENVLRFMA